MNPAAANNHNLDTVRAAIEHIGQGITVFDDQLRLVACNAKFLELLDFPAELSKPGTEFAAFMRHNARRGEYGTGDVESLVRQRVEQAMKFEPHTFERTRPDGTILHVEGSPLPDGGFVTVYTDVTEERLREAWLEDRVAERTKALRENETRLRIIANEVKAGIAHLDKDLVFRFANARFSRAYGWREGDIIGRPADQILPQPVMAASGARFTQALSGVSVDFDLEIELADGRRKDIRTFLRPEFGSGGSVSGFYVLSIDLTRQKAADRTLAQAQKMEALGRMAAGIAHDFNNLLTIVLGNLSPLQDRLQDGELSKEYLDPAVGAARRGALLTERLLTLTRRQIHRASPIRARDAIEDVIAILTASLPESTELRSCGDGSDPWLKADRGQLEMALINLVVNANAALDGPGRITLSCDEAVLGSEQAQALRLSPGSFCRLKVKDTGRGMAPEEQRLIFDPFYSGRPERGAGLGLAMVFAFVEQSEGAIEVHSHPGRGTAFTLLLPRAEPAQSRAPDRSVAATPPEPRDGPILLIEDDKQVRRVLRRQLVSLGHAVLEAESAEDAEQLLAGVEGIWMVISDVALTGRSGLAFAETLAADFPKLGVVLITGHGARPVKAAAPVGVQVLQKPVSDEDLESAIARVRRGGAL
ncbi:PAS-domain containing protein [Hoeflea sp. TYP-13]|uniref:hybrid sensor histidine kinase/response regulator n=1 Tax=Hoeflea sp. TYP-13 TaxID=3230023 RepID=UPI0034C66EA8